MAEFDELDETLLRYGAEETFTNKGWKALEKDIGNLLEVLEAKSEHSADLSGIAYKGVVFRTKSRNPQWVEIEASLNGDILTFKGLKGKSSVCRIGYVFTTKITKEDELIIKTGTKIKQRIILITQDDVIHIASDSEEETKAWLNVLRKMLRTKYTKEELQAKEEAKKELQPLLLEQERMKVQKFQLIIKTLADSGFFIEPRVKKEKEGYLDLERSGKEAKKLYVVLFKENLYLFKPHEKVSIDTQPYDWVDIMYISSVRPSKKKHCFVVRTLMRKFVFKAKHDVAVTEWVNAIRAFVEKKTHVPTSKIKSVKNDKGYTYTKPIDERMSLVIDLQNGSKPKTKKLKAGEHTIGRSSSNSVPITDDKYISRAHTRIVVEANVPYVVDLGSSSGTKLNGTKITKEPLKPGDVIEIGKSRITFEVKDGDAIFSVAGSGFGSSGGGSGKGSKNNSKKNDSASDSGGDVRLEGSH